MIGPVAFGANYYWVPGSRRDDVKVLQYADHLRIFLRHTCLGEYLTDQPDLSVYDQLLEEEKEEDEDDDERGQAQ